MDRKKTTEDLSQLLESQYLGRRGKYWAKEVSIDYGTTKVKRIDYMQFSPADQVSVSGIEKGVFICYEVKSCKEDVYSGNGLNFLGEKNYLVTTMDCYKKMLPDFNNGKLNQYIKDKFPESSIYYGVMVAIPYTAELSNEF